MEKGGEVATESDGEVAAGRDGEVARKVAMPTCAPSIAGTVETDLQNLKLSNQIVAIIHNPRRGTAGETFSI